MMTRHSIRVRLTAWYAGLTLVALIVMASSVILLVRHSVTRAVEERLSAHHDGLERFANALEVSLPADEVRDELREYAAGAVGGAFLELATSEGANLAHPDVSGWDAAIASLRPTSPSPRATAIDFLIGDAPYRASTRALTIHGASAQSIVAVALGPTDAALASVQRMLFWLLPLMSLIAAACGYVVSGRALRPVDRLTQAAQTINVENLHQRLDVPPAPDELQRLAVTFNGMLDRLQEGVGNIARFTSEASHELRTPVALVRTTAELALRRDRSPEEYQDALTDIHTQSREMSDLVDDLLTMARADAGVEPPPETVVDLGAVAAAFAASWRATSRFNLVRDDDPIMIRAEARQVQRLLSIVCENATKYGPEDGEVCVRLRAENGRAVIDVEDDGIGVAAGDLPRVFERFYRGARARAGEATGSGLGLSIAKVIAERHGGQIMLSSPIRALDGRATSARGTRVTITFPLATPDVTTAPHTRPAQ